MRLNKYLSACGVCSRREADRLIEGGRVEVNGRRAKVGQEVSQGDEVLIEGQKARLKEKRVFAYYKPEGVTCSASDEHARLLLSDVTDFPVPVTYAGRLDRDSEGLLIMTNDGELIDRMMKGSSGHEKEYAVKVDRILTDEFLEKMEKGIYLYDLKRKTRPCRVRRLSERSFGIVLTQGLNRQIRRMCMQLGYKAVRIRRIRVVNITLGDLKKGQWRELKGDELKELYKRVMKGVLSGKMKYRDRCDKI